MTETSGSGLPSHVPVLVVGGGPVGLACAALLATHGIESHVVEADDDYCSGSRAVCISRRSQEIFSWFGGERDLLAKALPWTDGRSYFRGQEVLHFTMPSAGDDRFAPMLNVQQYYMERFCHAALQRQAQTGSAVHWATPLTRLKSTADGVEATVRTADGGEHTVRADWLVACDGARSKVRSELGLSLQGRQYEGRYVIVDIEQETGIRVGRRVWFDPPSNPGSTVVMHQQPDNVWRIDYQVRDDEDPEEVVKPENVLPRVQRHLEMIGQAQPWKPIWISSYNAKCLSLQDYRHGRVLFAGDAAHLVPIFGVRGLNSGFDDAMNLAWKLALVVQGQAGDTLLDSYSRERVPAAHENMAYGAKSTEFMTPPHRGFDLMREATLRLALADKRVAPLINPRQSTPIVYAGSPLNVETGDDTLPARAGSPAPDARLEGPLGARYLSELFGRGFVALFFSEQAPVPRELAAAAEPDRPPATLKLVRIAKAADPGPGGLRDPAGTAWQRYGATDGCLVLVRPDGYVLARWRQPSRSALDAALCSFRQPIPEQA